MYFIEEFHKLDPNVSNSYHDYHDWILMFDFSLISSDVSISIEIYDFNYNSCDSTYNVSYLHWLLWYSVMKPCYFLKQNI